MTQRHSLAGADAGSFSGDTAEILAACVARCLERLKVSPHLPTNSLKTTAESNHGEKRDADRS